VVIFFYKTFSAGRTGHGRPFSWSPPSFDVTSLDFFLCEYVQDCVDATCVDGSATLPASVAEANRSVAKGTLTIHEQNWTIDLMQSGLLEFPTLKQNKERIHFLTSGTIRKGLPIFTYCGYHVINFYNRNRDLWTFCSMARGMGLGAYTVFISLRNMFREHSNEHPVCIKCGEFHRYDTTYCVMKKTLPIDLVPWLARISSLVKY